MADGTYENGLSLSRRWEDLDVRVLILNNSTTPVFNVRDANLEDVLARAGNTEESGTRDTAVPGRTYSDDTLDHGDIVYSAPAAGNWVAAVYYVLGDSDSESPVLHFKDAVATPDGVGDITLATGASGLVDVSRQDGTRVVTDDENEPYTTRIVHADLNYWEDSQNALVITGP